MDRIWWALAVMGVLCLGASARAAGEFSVIVDPGNAFSFYVVQGKKQAIRVGFGAWGAKWAAVDVKGNLNAGRDVLVADGTAVFDANTQDTAAVHLRASETGQRAVRFEYTVGALKDIPLRLIGPVVSAPSGHNFQAKLTAPGTKDVYVKLPANAAADQAASGMIFAADNWDGPIEAKLDREMKVGVNDGLRVQMASGTLKAGETKMTLTMTFPEDVTFQYKPADMAKVAPVVPTANWFAYEPTWDMGQSAIGMEDWLGKPAGKHGGVRMVGDHFEFADGTPVKFWGTNIGSAECAPTKADADFTAARFAKYGVNAVRLHKFTGVGWAGIGDPNDATKMTADGLDRFDYFTSKLAEKGVYYGWSHTYHFTVRPGNKDRVAGYDELMKKGGDTYGVINWAEDVQDLMIEQVVNLLKHRNPYTGKAYAEDPALSYIELQNEDDIFFYTSAPAYDDFPTYARLLRQRFSQWLTGKYGTQEKLASTWASALHAGESLEKNNIAVQMNPWFMSDQHLPELKAGERQRMLDNAAFLFETQKRFYDKFVKAIRATGYAGPLVGSPWQAPSMLPHYENLLADEQVGYIDRHDYFGGGVNDTMLKTPGGGYLSAGLQQVAGRPFGMSEWIDVYPSLYSAEGPVLVAAYGMGLQGWSASYEFASTSKHLDKDAIVGKEPWGVWNADAPTQMGQYPILARMIERGDVKQGPVISVRRISPADLAGGRFNFAESVQQSGDIKSFAGTVSPETLAAGRALVEFTPESAASTFPDLTKYRQGQVIISATGQLTWDADNRVVTIDTPGTQGVVGFAAGRKITLGNVTIQSACPFASILVTAAEKSETLADAKRVLVSAVARNANTGFRYLDIEGTPIVDNGHAPIVLEPVKAQVTFPGRHIVDVRVLDADGRETGRGAAMGADGFTIDGVRDRAMYYEAGLE